MVCAQHAEIMVARDTDILQESRIGNQPDKRVFHADRCMSRRHWGALWRDCRLIGDRLQVNHILSGRKLAA